MPGCHRCPNPTDDCECSPCAACGDYVWSELMARNIDRDWVCPDCKAHGRRSAAAIEADEDDANYTPATAA